MIIIGGLTVVLATALLAFAAFLYWVDGKRDGDGFFITGAVHMTTSTYAITSDDLDIKEGVLAFVGADGSSGARLRVRSNTRTPIFVGVAHPTDVEDYLRDSAHETLQEVDFAPFRPTYLTAGGDQPPAAPTEETFWTASASGSGTQTLEWDLASGESSVVLMNADGSKGVDATVRAGAKVDLVGRVARIVTIAGLVFLAIGVLLIVLGLRRRQQPSSPDGSAWAA